MDKTPEELRDIATKYGTKGWCEVAAGALILSVSNLKSVENLGACRLLVSSAQTLIACAQFLDGMPLPDPGELIEAMATARADLEDGADALSQAANDLRDAAAELKETQEETKE